MMVAVPLAAEKKVIAPPEFPKGAPYSPGILVDGTLYVSGQAGQDLKTRELPKEFEAEVKQTLANIDKLLAGYLRDTHQLNVRVVTRGSRSQAILQFTRNYHLGNGVRQPLFDLLHHIAYIRVDKAIQFIRPEAEPRHSLQEAVSATVRTSPSHHQLPEPEALNLRILARPAKLAYKVRSSFFGNHGNPGNLRCPCGSITPILRHKSFPLGCLLANSK